MKQGRSKRGERVVLTFHPSTPRNCSRAWRQLAMRASMPSFGRFAFDFLPKLDHIFRASKATRSRQPRAWPDRLWTRWHGSFATPRSRNGGLSFRRPWVDATDADKEARFRHVVPRSDFRQCLPEVQESKSSPVHDRGFQPCQKANVA